MDAVHLQRLLARAIALSISAVAACDGSSNSTSPSSGVWTLPSDYQPVTCDTATALFSLEPIRKVTGADYIELRHWMLATEARDASLEPGRTIASSRTKCAGATDRDACLRAIDTATSDHGFVQFYLDVACPCYSYVVVNQGDSVRVIATLDELRGFLGAIDAPEKAQLVVWANGYDLACNASNASGVKQSDDGYEIIATRMTQDCPIQTTRYYLRVGRDASVSELRREIASDHGGCIGRRPLGLVAARQRKRSVGVLGEHFAHSARLEAASVDAFLILRDELTFHGAPKKLLAAAARAARDEIGHARMTARLARRFGGRPIPTVVARKPVRDLEEIAVENAIEGCVRETFGALVGMWQAKTAKDPLVAKTMKALASDEVRHAALSWDVAQWLRENLSVEACSRVESAKRAAVVALLDALRTSPSKELIEQAGLPPVHVALKLAQSLEHQLWRSRRRSCRPGTSDSRSP